MAAVPAQASRVKIRHVPTIQTAFFHMGTNARVAVGTNHAAALSDVKVGDVITVGYDNVNGAFMAQRISDGVPPAPPKPRHINANPTPKASHPHTHTTPVLAHIHGTVQAVDPQAGTFILAFHKK